MLGLEVVLVQDVRGGPNRGNTFSQKLLWSASSPRLWQASRWIAAFRLPDERALQQLRTSGDHRGSSPGVFAAKGETFRVLWTPGTVSPQDRIECLTLGSKRID